MRYNRLYRHAHFYMLRAPALPASIFLQIAASCEESTTDDISLAQRLQTQREHCYQLLCKLAVQPEIALALAVASSSLEEGLARLSSESHSSTRTKRTFTSLLRYITRMSTRPTPFGLFSGVALGTFADQTDVLLSTPSIQHIRTRPDMSWLLEVLQKIENDRIVVQQLRFRANPTVYIMGDRVVVHIYEQQENHTISLRATSVVRKALELASHPIAYAQFCDALMQTFPGATLPQVENLFWQLLGNRFLLSDLHPPLTHTRPADYVYEYLANLERVQEISRQLSLVLEGARAIDASGASAPVVLLHKLSRLQGAMNPGTKQRQLQVQIDAALRLSSSQLHRSMGDAAALAAEILLRLSSAPEGSRTLQEYRNLFIERYGSGAEVPLLDLLSAENGLDAPQGYEQPPRAYHSPTTLPPPDTSKRDRVLQKLVASAINTQSLEIELTEQLLHQLEHWPPKLTKAPYSLEIYLQVHARSCEALDRGEWYAVVAPNCGSMAAGSTFGRFLDILGEEGMEALRQITLQEQGLNPQAIFAELSYQPRRTRDVNVAIRPSLRAYEIPFGTTPSVAPEHVIPLSDLVVGVKNERFYLRSVRLNKQIIVCQSHMINMRSAPNVCRFIAELTHDGFPLLNSFYWGNVWYSPFLPRVIVRSGPSASIVLSPAQWFVESSTIVPAGEGDEETRWFRGVLNWREQWRVPRYIYLTQSDNRLLLDLEHPLMVAELCSEVVKLSREARIQLQEVLPDFDTLWLYDERGESYFSEIVVPLLRADAPTADAPTATALSEPVAVRAPDILPHRERCIFPGEDWLYLKLYSAYNQHNKLIAIHVKKILEQLLEHDLIDNWFFIRYGDPEPHLRIRFHTKCSEAFHPMLSTLLEWSCQLARQSIIQHYTLDTYTRELERYGGPSSIVYLERVFGIDSTMISNLLAARHLKRLTLDSQMIAVFTLDHFLAAWGWDFQQRLFWLRGRTRQYEASQEFSPVRKMYCELLSPWAPHPDPHLTEQRTQLLELLMPHEQLLAEIGMQVRALATNRSLCTSEDELVASLVHMHCNRLLGINRVLERQTYAFWRHALESLSKRPAQLRSGKS